MYVITTHSFVPQSVVTGTAKNDMLNISNMPVLYLNLLLVGPSARRCGWTVPCPYRLDLVAVLKIKPRSLVKCRYTYIKLSVDGRPFVGVVLKARFNGLLRERLV